MFFSENTYLCVFCVIDTVHRYQKEVACIKYKRLVFLNEYTNVWGTCAKVSWAWVWIRKNKPHLLNCRQLLLLLKYRIWLVKKEPWLTYSIFCLELCINYLIIDILLCVKIKGNIYQSLCCHYSQSHVLPYPWTTNTLLVEEWIVWLNYMISTQER